METRIALDKNVFSTIKELHVQFNKTYTTKYRNEINITKCFPKLLRLLITNYSTDVEIVAKAKNMLLD